MILNIRDIDMESVNKCMSKHEGEFEAWYNSDDSKPWREPLEEAVSLLSRRSPTFGQQRTKLLRDLLHDFAAAAWIQSRVAMLRAENAEAASFLPVDKRDLLNG